MPEVTRKVGPYELLHEIGSGGMAVVYLAHQVNLGRQVALKEIRGYLASDPTVAKRFVREARLAAKLTHTNVVTVFDFIVHDGTPYIAMEYLHRGSLRRHVSHVTFAQISWILQGLLAGLTCFEQYNVVHRDIKPENLLIAPDGRIKIADFGLAKAVVETMGVDAVEPSDEPHLTAVGMTVGTPAYMAPEQVENRDIGPWTDLYAVGCVAYELFTGHVPFPQRGSPLAVMVRQVVDEIPPARSVNPEISQPISDWIDRLLVKDYVNRTQSARGAWDELEDIVIEMLGPRWHRQASLAAVPAVGVGEPSADVDTSDPEALDPYWTLGRGSQEEVAPPMPGPATPPPQGLPPGPMMPQAVNVLTGPPTPLSMDVPAVPATVRSAAAAPPTAAARPPESLAAAEVAVVPPARTTVRRIAAPREPGAHRSRGLLLGCLLALVIVGIVAAIVTSNDGPKPDATTTPEPASRAPATSQVAPGVELAAGPLSMRAAPGWQRVPAANPLPGLALRPVASAAPEGKARAGRVLLGLATSKADTAALLSPAFLHALGLRRGVIPPHTVVRGLSGGLQAFRYDDLHPQGLSRRVTIFASPTTAGVAIVACIGAASATPAAGACQTAASNLALAGATGYPVGPNRAHAAAVNRTLDSLARELNGRRAGLGKAKTAAAQATAAGAIAGAFRSSHSALSGRRLSPADRTDNIQLERAFASTAATYRDLSTAAREGASGAYQRAAHRSVRAQNAIVRALAQLARDGYAGLITRHYRQRSIPPLKQPPTPAPSQSRSSPKTLPPALPQSSAGPTRKPKPSPVQTP